MVTEVTKFITNDGKEFSTRAEAEMHEQTGPIIQKLGSIFGRDGESTDPDWLAVYVDFDEDKEPVISTRNLGSFLLSNLEPIKKVFDLKSVHEVQSIADAAYAAGKAAAHDTDVE